MYNESTMTKLLNEVKKTLDKYNSDNIDVIREKPAEENGYVDNVYVVYHSKHNSSPVSDNTYPFDELDINALERKLDELDVGYTWD